MAITCPPASITRLACWIGVILTVPADVSNSCTGRFGWAKATVAARSIPAVHVIRGDSTARGRHLRQRLECDFAQVAVAVHKCDNRPRCIGRVVTKDSQLDVVALEGHGAVEPREKDQGLLVC